MTIPAKTSQTIYQVFCESALAQTNPTMFKGVRNGFSYQQHWNLSAGFLHTWKSPKYVCKADRISVDGLSPEIKYSYHGGRHRKSCTRQDFRARTSDKGCIENWGRFPILGLGLPLAHVQDFWCLCWKLVVVSPTPLVAWQEYFLLS